jgi:hypothetical protein
MKINFLNKISVLSILAITLFILTFPSTASTQEWQVNLYSENPEYIQVIVDGNTFGASSKTVIDDVFFEVYFLDSQDLLIEVDTFIYTNEKLPHLGPKKYRRFFQHPYPTAKSVKGGYITYTMVTTWGQFHHANKMQAKSSEVIQDTFNIHTIDSIPEPTSIQRQYNFDGSYNMVHDGWKGILNIKSHRAEYITADGRKFRVKLSINENRIIFYVVGLGGENADGTGGQKFEGYMMTQTKDAIAGTTWWHNRPFGFYAIKK